MSRGDRILVSRGQIWRTRPRRKGARIQLVRIVGVAKGLRDRHKHYMQPTVTYRPVTASGKLQGRKSDQPHRHFLTCTEKGWTMTEQWEMHDE